MIIESPALGQGDNFLKKYTCEGENVNPPLNFRDIPEGTRSLALIMEDIDASNPTGVFLHWILWNLPPDMPGLDENAVIGTMGIAGSNDGNRDYYEGPCPKNGSHRYVFTLYALDSLLNVPKTIKKLGLLEAMQGHIIAQASLTKSYQKEDPNFDPSA